jgi:hypothetical protein
VNVSASDALSSLVRYVRVDGGVWEVVDATNRTTYVLGDGPHTIECWSVDAAGNAQPPPLSNVSFVVDTVTPEMTVAVSGSVLASQGCFSLPDSPTPVCNSSEAMSFPVSCVESANASRSPCEIQWQMETLALSSTGGSCAAGGGSGNSGGVWQRHGGGVLFPNPSRDGKYLLTWRVVDGAGNIGEQRSLEFWRDTIRPPKEPTLLSTPDKTVYATSAQFEMQVKGDTSPGRLSFVYLLSRGVVADPLASAPLPEPTNDDIVQLVLTNLAVDTSYSITIWTQDQAGLRSSKATVFDWYVASVAPIVRVDWRPAAISALRTPRFVFVATWGENAKKTGVVPEASFQVSLVGVNSPHSPCEEAGSRSNCTSWCNGTSCEYMPLLDRPAAYTLQVQAVLYSKAGDITTVLWEYKRCLSTEYAVLTNGDSIVCKPCPEGGDCSTSDVSEVIELNEVVAQQGWWASEESSGAKFYKCAIPESCLAGNSSRAQCAPGYSHVACSVCSLGYFEQFGKCVPCPATAATSYVTLVGAAVVIIAIVGLLFKIRELLPMDLLKIGVTMAQIIASANSAYEIPWPKEFTSYLDNMKIFLVRIASVRFP